MTSIVKAVKGVNVRVTEGFPTPIEITAESRAAVGVLGDASSVAQFLIWTALARLDALSTITQFLIWTALARPDAGLIVAHSIILAALVGSFWFTFAVATGHLIWAAGEFINAKAIVTTPL